MSDILRKAVLDTTASTTGNNLIPEVINPAIIDIARRLSVVRKFVPRKEWDSDIFSYRLRTADAQAQAYGEGDTWSINSSTYAAGSQQMKTIGVLGGVSNKLQAGSKAFTNAFADEIESATRSFAKLEEHLLLNGNAANFANQFNGVAAQLASNNGYSSAAAPVQVTAELLNEMDDDIVGRGFGLDPAACAWVVTPKIASVIANLQVQYYRETGKITGLAGGANILAWRDKQVLRSSAAEQVVKVSNETVTISNKQGTLAQNYAILNTFDDQVGNLYNGGVAAPAPVVQIAGVTQNSGYSFAQDPLSGATTLTFTAAPSGAVTVTYFYKQQSIFLVDFSTMVMPYTLDLSYEELPPQMIDEKLFRVKAYECLAVQAEMGNAQALNIHG